MLKIACAGLGGRDIAKAANEAGQGKVKAEVFSDMEASKQVKKGNMDYLIGSCLSGSGGALSIAIGVLGYNQTIRISTAGGAPSEEKVREAVLSGDKKAFGINADHAVKVTPYIIKALLEKHGLTDQE